MKGMAATIIGMVILLVIAVTIVLGMVVVKNGLIARDEAVDEAWAQIDTQLLRRADLIPNLVNTVKGYAKHEKDVFQVVSDARSRLLSAKSPDQKAQASAMLDIGLGRVLAIAENYPRLKADTSFIRLQDELAGTENRIAVARTRYNKSVKEYNSAIRKFPGSMFAPDMGLEKREYFEPPDRKTLEKAPEVEF